MDHIKIDRIDVFSKIGTTDELLESTYFYIENADAYVCKLDSRKIKINCLMKSAAADYTLTNEEALKLAFEIIRVLVHETSV